MRRKLLTLLCGLMLLGTSTVAQAEVRGGSFGITPFVGGMTYDGAMHLKTSPMAGIRAGYNFTDNFGFEGMFGYTNTESTGQDVLGFFGKKPDFDIYSYRGELLYHFMPASKFVPFLAAGYGATTFHANNVPFDPFETSSAQTKGTFSAGGGFKYFFTKDIALRFDARDLIVSQVPTDRGEQTVNNYEYTLGAYFQFGGEKPAPPPVAPPPPPPAPKPEPVVAPPPPPPAPTSSISVTPTTITRGQSATLAWSSENTKDCTIDPGGNVQTQNSIKISPAADTTYTLTCNGPGGTTTSSAKLTVQAPPPQRVCITLDILFDFDKSVIKPQYHDEIKKAADFLIKYDFVTGVIDGYTDNKGSYKYNQKLSQRRAEAVRTYLIEKFGIKPERLGAKGHSYDNPVASNDTAEGRAKNRRIEANFECIIKE